MFRPTSFSCLLVGSDKCYKDFCNSHSIFFMVIVLAIATFYENPKAY